MFKSIILQTLRKLTLALGTELSLVILRAFSRDQLTLYPNLLCSQSFLGLDLVADLELERLEAGFSLEAEQLYFGIDPYQHFEAEFCLQAAMAADFLPLMADSEIECHLETVFLADIDADHLESALEAAFHQHFVVDLELQLDADSEVDLAALRQ